MGRVSDMSYLSSKGLPTYSDLGFGESLTKFGRHKLCLLCLEAIRDELSRKPIPNKSRGRGRPLSPASILAMRMKVHPDSIRRWTNLREAQASDGNTEKLAAMAVKFSPEGVTRILREDLDRYRETMEGWLNRVAPNKSIHLRDENIESKEGA